MYNRAPWPRDKARGFSSHPLALRLSTPFTTPYIVGLHRFAEISALGLVSGLYIASGDEF